MPDILDTVRCKLCDRYIFDTFESSYGSIIPKYHHFIFRWDLTEYVCCNCDRELGPDLLRVNAMKLCKDPSILEDYLNRFNSRKDKEHV